MKFARFLQDAQVPEWKKAYIDYRALKKLITAIRDAQEREEHEGEPLTVDEESPRASMSAEVQARDGNSPSGLTRPESTGDILPVSSAERDSDMPPKESPEPVPSHSHQIIINSATPSQLAEKQDSTDPSPGFLTTLRRRHTTRSHHPRHLNSTGFVLPLFVILSRLRPIERKYIDRLDKELEKVEKFYLDREREAVQQATALEKQLGELEEHRRLVQEAKDGETNWRSVLSSRTVADQQGVSESPRASSTDLQGGHSSSPMREKESKASKIKSKFPPHVVESEPKDSHSRVSSQASRRSGSPTANRRRARMDPDEYKNARKNIKKAVLEYYKFLEMLNNYRVLNLTGFRKALKKFEKTVEAPDIQQAYMQEKVEISAFASGETIEKLLKDIEDQYARYFVHGDLKKARERLRASENQKTHTFSTFRTGLYLGLAVPALVDGIYRSFQPEVRESMPWDALLYIYATFLIPLVLALLIGVNMWVWNRSRINYQFIFELDVRSQLDSREYFELPAFLLCTLIYAFWLSFARIGTSDVAPTTWPIVWLVFALLVLFIPLPIFHWSSRWWFIRKVGKLLLSGMLPVQFADFWIGDQISSLIFSVSNLYIVGCVYAEDLKDPFSKCNTSSHWVVPFILSVLPLGARAVQSVRRNVDSGLYTHLINAGKYFLNVGYYLFYYLWRHHGRKHDFTFVLFCFFGTLVSIYTSAWDILMDWSLFQRRAKHRFLRKDLVYQNFYPAYYLAIITNIIARFQWVSYLYGSNDDFRLRTFIVAMIEMLRRFQWNFFRLENEHIGNTDQYRATREIPLPYSFDRDGVEENDMDVEEEEKSPSLSARSRSWRERM